MVVRIMECVLWQRGLLPASVVSGEHGRRTAAGLSAGQDLLQGKNWRQC